MHTVTYNYAYWSLICCVNLLPNTYVSKLFEKILYIKKSFAKLAKAHQIKWQIKIIKFYI